MTNQQLADILDEWAKERNKWDKYGLESKASQFLKEAARRLR